MYILGGFTRFIDLSLDNNGDIMYSSYACENECRITEASNEYFVFQQAEITCDTSASIYSTVLFFISFEFTIVASDDSSNMENELQECILSVFENAYDTEINSFNIESNATTTDDRRTLLDSTVIYTLNSSIYLYYNDRTAYDDAINVYSLSTFESNLTSNLYSFLTSIDTYSIVNLQTNLDSSDEGSLQQDAAALTTSATSGIAYSIGLVNADEYDLIEYFSDLSYRNSSNLTIANELSVYPGGTLTFWIAVIDDSGTIVNPERFNETITVYLYEDENLHIDETQTVIYATNKLETNSITMSSVTNSQINETYVLNISIEDNLLRATSVDITIALCPAGYGISGTQCVECVSGFYTIEENNYACKECPDDEGITCSGGTDLVIDSDYWAYEKSNGQLKIVDCPDSFCCQLDDGCNYFDDSEDFCATARDNDEPLCGHCIEGYSEVLVGTGCAKCETNQWYWIFLPIFVCMAFVLFVLVNKKEARDDEIYILSDTQVIKIALLKNLAYYYQILNLTFPNNVTVYLRSVLALFSISIDTSDADGSTDDSGDTVSTIWCFYPGMGPLMKVSIQFLIPMIAYTILAIIRIINPKSIFGKDLQYANAFGQISLMSLGSIVTTGLKLTECRPVDGVDVLSYAGSHECYGVTWYLALLTLIGVFGGFSFVFYKLKHMPHRARSRDIHPLVSLTDPFVEDRWWWEFALIARRVSLAILGLFTYYDEPLIEFLMIVIVIISLWSQSWYSPFRDPFNDALEVFCLICLLSMVSAVFSDDLVDSDNDFISILAVIIIILPLVWVILYVVYVKCGKNVTLPIGDGMTLEQAMILIEAKTTPYAVRRHLRTAIRQGTIYSSHDNITLNPLMNHKNMNYKDKALQRSNTDNSNDNYHNATAGSTQTSTILIAGDGGTNTNIHRSSKNTLGLKEFNASTEVSSLLTAGETDNSDDARSNFDKMKSQSIDVARLTNTLKGNDENLLSEHIQGNNYNKMPKATSKKSIDVDLADSSDDDDDDNDDANNNNANNNNNSHNKDEDDDNVIVYEENKANKNGVKLCKEDSKSIPLSDEDFNATIDFMKDEKENENKNKNENENENEREISNFSIGSMQIESMNDDMIDQVAAQLDEDNDNDEINGPRTSKSQNKSIEMMKVDNNNNNNNNRLVPMHNGHDNDESITSVTGMNRDMTNMLLNDNDQSHKD